MHTSHNFWCTHWHTLSPTRKTATAAFICSRIDPEFASSAQSSDNQQYDENDLGILKLIGGKQHFFLNTKKWRIPFVVAGIETGRDVSWLRRAQIKELAWPMEERQIGHRKSRFVFFARFTVVNRLSQSRSLGFLVWCGLVRRSLSRYALKSSTCEQVYVVNWCSRSVAKSA